MEARARRAAAAVGLAAALVAAVGAFYLRPWQAFEPRPAAAPPPTAQARPPTVLQADFVSADVGWILTGGPILESLYRTVDGGRHWRRQLDGIAANGWNLSFFDARRGVLYVAGQRGPELLETADGGQHWTRTTPACQSPATLVFFLDLAHGWCTSVSGGAYRTSDGGLDWSPAGGGLTGEGQESWIWFSDASRGWIGQDSPGGQAVVYATTDAGDHWSRQELPPPAGGWGSTAGTLEDTPPERGSGSSPSVVVAVLEQGPRQGELDVDGRYVATWQASGWQRPVPVPSGPVTLADRTHWFVVMGTSVLESSDGGESWTTLGAPAPGWVAGSLTMVDHDHGWATLYRLAPPGSPGSTIALARTADAGRHWAMVTLPS